MQARDRHAHVLVHRVHLAQTSRNGGHLALRAGKGDVRVQPAVTLEGARSGRAGVGGIQDERREDGRLVAADLEAARSHTDHGERAGGKAEFTAQHAGVAAEPALPERVSKDCHLRSARSRVGIDEAAPERRDDTEHAEQIRRRHHAADLFGALRAHHVQGRRLHEDERLEHPGPGTPLDEVLRMHVQWCRNIERALVQHHDPAWRRVWKRAQQHRIGKGEDRGTRPDAQRQDGDDRRGERGAAAQRPTGVSHVLEGIVEPRQTARVAARLDRARQCAHFSNGAVSCVDGRQAGLDVALDQEVDMVPQFVIEIAVHQPSPEQRSQPQAEE